MKHFGVVSSMKEPSSSAAMHNKCGHVSHVASDTEEQSLSHVSVRPAAVKEKVPQPCFFFSLPYRVKIITAHSV
eukprot:gene1271-729_t